MLYLITFISTFVLRCSFFLKLIIHCLSIRFCCYCYLSHLYAMQQFYLWNFIIYVHTVHVQPLLHIMLALYSIPSRQISLLNDHITTHIYQEMQQWFFEFMSLFCAVCNKRLMSHYTHYQ